jgi:general secretion pathway protein G
MHVIETALDLFRDEFEGLPKQLSQAVPSPPSDPWGRPYEYLRIAGSKPSEMGKRRKDKNLVPINSDYDLYSRGADGSRCTTPRIRAGTTTSSSHPR